MTDTALLLVDLQNDYFEGGKFPLADSTARVRNASRILTACREKGIPVIHIRHESIHPGAGFFFPGTPGADFHPLVKPADGETVITKHLVSSYKLTPLARELKKRGIKTVLVGGMQSNVCAASLTRESVKRGYRTLLLADTLAATTEEVHQSMLKELSAVVHGSLSADEAVRMVQGIGGI